MTNICLNNINVYSSTEFNKPKTLFQNDYRTSTGVGLRLMDAPPHDPTILRECPLSLLPNKYRDNPCLTRTAHTTTYRSGCIDPNAPRLPSEEKAQGVPRVHHVKRLQEKIFKDPPRPFLNYTTTNRRDYSWNEVKTVPDVAPKLSLVLDSRKADESFYFKSNESGYVRYLDPYATTNQITHVPFTKNMQNGVAKKDVITLYDAQNTPKGGLGFGPKISRPIRPNPADPIQDKMLFKTKCFARIMPKRINRVPHSGLITEVQSNYKVPVGREFNAGIVDAPTLHQSPWQDLASPYMYCKEYCHIAHRMPVDAVVNVYHKK